MHNSTKIEFVNIFKNDYAASSYLRLTSILEKEKNLWNLGWATTNEAGRYDQIPRLTEFDIFVNLIKLKTNFTFLCIAINTLF